MKKLVFFEAQKLKGNLLQLMDLDILGPVSSPIFKIKNNYRTRLLIRSKTDDFIQKKLREILRKINISKKLNLRLMLTL